MGIDFTEKGFNITHEISMSGARYLVKTDVDIPNKFRLNGNYDVKVTDELRSDLKAIVNSDYAVRKNSRWRFDNYFWANLYPTVYFYNDYGKINSYKKYDQ